MSASWMNYSACKRAFVKQESIGLNTHHLITICNTNDVSERVTGMADSTKALRGHITLELELVIS